MTPTFLIKTSDWQINHALRIALGDFYGNIVPFQAGLLDAAVPCVNAGLWYDNPWTRDAAINTWNAAGMIVPEAARNTLLSALNPDTEGRLMIRGQYWDKIIWTTGAWRLYLSTADRDFLELAFDASRNTLAQLETDVFDVDYGLFRGEACFHDGISAYPDRFVRYMVESHKHRLEEQACCNDPDVYVPDEGCPIGSDIPYFTLSTNSLYFNAYRVLEHMAGALDRPIDPEWTRKAEGLRRRINDAFWNEECGHYRYLVDTDGGDERQDALGNAFAVLFGVADPAKTARLMESQPTTPQGVPCIWPTFDRFKAAGEHEYGTHSGTVWPMVQGFWCQAAAVAGRVELAKAEIDAWTANIRRDNQCEEMYHPETGVSYGGFNDTVEGGIHPHGSGSRQTWSATGYLGVFLHAFVGMRFDGEEIRCEQCLPEGLDWIEVTGLWHRGRFMNLRVEK